MVRDDFDLAVNKSGEFLDSHVRELLLLVFSREFNLTQGLENSVDLLCEEKFLCVESHVCVGAFVGKVLAKCALFSFNTFQFNYELLAQVFNSGPYIRSI